MGLFQNGCLQHCLHNWKLCIVADFFKDHEKEIFAANHEEWLLAAPSSSNHYFLTTISLKRGHHSTKKMRAQLIVFKFKDKSIIKLIFRSDWASLLFSPLHYSLEFWANLSDIDTLQHHYFLALNYFDFGLDIDYLNSVRLMLSYSQEVGCFFRTMLLCSSAVFCSFLKTQVH